MVDFKKKDHYDFSDLLEITRLLRAPGGCPWDIEQTHASIRKNIIEEAYEAAGAIDEGSDAHLCEELGDVIYQVAFHAVMAAERNAFTIDDIIDGIAGKLVFRHPHVFGDTTVADSKEVLKNWDELKRIEKVQKTYTQAMDEVTKCLPALTYAEKIQKRAARAGFDWPDINGAVDKVREESEEVLKAVQTGGNVEEELGDLLFAAVNVSRFIDADPEEVLGNATKKFMRRFAKVEAAAGENMKNMSLEELDKLWDKAKAEE